MREQSLTIHEGFAAQVLLNEHHTAVIFNGTSMSYRELNQRANVVASLLIDKGARPDKIVAIMTERSLEMIIAILAILKSGAAYMPIDPRLPRDRIEYMLQDSKAELLVTQSGVTDKEFDYTGEVIKIDATLNHVDAPEVSYPNQPHDLCYAIYTSGTTGLPKGVLIEHRNVMNLMQGLHEIVYQHYPNPLRVALVAPYYFDASVQQIFASLLGGHTLIIVPEETRIDGNKLLAFYNEYAVVISDGTPAHIAMLTYAMKSYQVNLSVKQFIIGGEELTPLRAGEFMNCFLTLPPVVTNIYGPTECCVDSLAYTIKPEDVGTGVIPIGRPLLNQNVYLLQENKQVPAGSPGELYISGAGVGRGYLNLPELTSRFFVNCPFEDDSIMYKTGDLATTRPDGNIVYMGRSDFQVKVRGYRIEIDEIKATLSTHPSIHEVEIHPWKDQREETYLCAYIVSPEKWDAADLKIYLAEKLPAYMVPSYFVPIEKIPLNRNGKLDRKALPEPIGNEPERTSSGVPQNETEEMLLAIWKDVLGVQNSGVNDHFFEWGGHSLKANLLVSTIMRQFGVEISLQDVFDKPILRDIALIIAQAAPSDKTSIEVAPNLAYYPLTIAQNWMYMLSIRHADSITWNMPGALVIEGAFDTDAFFKAIQLVVARHAILRTSFDWVQGVPVQKVWENATVPVQVSKVTDVEIMDRIHRFVRPFDIGIAPLIRTEILRIDDSKHIFLFDAHHLVFDGASIGIFMQEVADAYHGKSLDTHQLQYKDFTVWQNAYLTDERLSELEVYWLNAFTGPIPMLEIPSDYARPLQLSGAGETLYFIIEPSLADRISRMSVEKGSSIYMILLAALNVLLYKYTGTEDIVIGSLSAGRASAELEKMIGMFVNTLPMRNFPQGNKTFTAFLHEVKTHALQAYTHEDYPAERFETNIKMKKRPSHRPLFDVMFTFLNFDDQELKLTDLTIKPYPLELHLSRFDIVMEAHQSADGIAYQLNYSTDLFKSETIMQMKDDYLAILALLMDNPEICLKDIDWRENDWNTDQSELETIDFSF
ncbi:non-ribosomal peptide synthetase [Paenibacillus glacialis]|uniref:Carrier domain-containing protein n=1 Tax=Paenibacillus glacialis TaxID=494026 RepID=A0A168MJG1_9BACL|nr:non-ribosomal peptide synthetase [Paenibacillus glacialis]OAB44754.1 hypothetical protein PGLA_04895 [Paenibacillus glacialis]